MTPPNLLSYNEGTLYFFFYRSANACVELFEKGLSLVSKIFHGPLNIQGKDVEESVNEIESELLKALLIHNVKDDRVIFLMLLKLSLSFLNRAVDNTDNSRLVLYMQ